MSLTTYSLAVLNNMLSKEKNVIGMGAKGDGKTNNLSVFNSIIADINSGSITNIYIPSGDYVIQGTLTTITKSCTIYGDGMDQSRLLFDNSNGFTINFSDTSKNQFNASINNLGFFTNVATKIGLSVSRWDAHIPIGQCLDLESCSFNTYFDIDLSSNNTDEWLNAIYLNADAVNIEKVFINGAFDNLHNHTASTSSIGIHAAECTNVKVTGSRIYGVGIGMQVSGQSEDVSFDHSFVVGATKGILYTNLVSPANNHFIGNNHFATWKEGIEFDTLGDSAAYNLITNNFLLERTAASYPKSYDWNAMNLDVTSSIVSTNHIQGGNDAGSSANATSIRISDQGNIVDLLNSVWVDYFIDTIAVSAGNNYVKATGLRGTYDIAESKNDTIYTEIGYTGVVGGQNIVSGYSFK